MSALIPLPRGTLPTGMLFPGRRQAAASRDNRQVIGCSGRRRGATYPAPGTARLKSTASLLLRLAAVVLKMALGKLSALVSKLEWLRLKYLDYAPRPDDIFIVTYPRSGTTWMQMILYQLTTDGNMNFPHITQHCPWFERSLKAGKGFDTLPAPRLFKSHLP